MLDTKEYLNTVNVFSVGNLGLVGANKKIILPCESPILLANEKGTKDVFNNVGISNLKKIY